MTTQNIAKKIIQEIEKGTVDPTDALDIVKKVAKIVHGDKEAAVDVIDILARGHDKILGTPDDLIPPQTVKQLKALLDTALVAQLAYELSSKKCWCF